MAVSLSGTGASATVARAASGGFLARTSTVSNCFFGMKSETGKRGLGATPLLGKFGARPVSDSLSYWPSILHAQIRERTRPYSMG